MVVGVFEVWLFDCGGNFVVVVCGDCLWMVVDVFLFGKLGREFLVGYVG